VRRAFTSGMILRKLAGEGTHIDNVPQALERLLAEGCTDVVVQPTHVMNGEEYHKLLTQAEPYRARFARMSFGRPLLTAAEDYAALGRALMEALPAQRADTAVLYMGHGSEHQANSAYALMEYAFHDLGRKDVVIGTVEGYPGFGEALRRLKERPQVRRVELRPLMTVAGDHAKNDLAGDEEDSWRRRLCHLPPHPRPGRLPHSFSHRQDRGGRRAHRPGGVPGGAGAVCGARQAGGTAPGGSLLI
jgi:sirohydrochlorin cobaltochelatase